MGQLLTVNLGMPLGAKSRSKEKWMLFWRSVRRSYPDGNLSMSLGGRPTLINVVLDVLTI